MRMALPKTRSEKKNFRGTYAANREYKRNKLFWTKMSNNSF